MSDERIDTGPVPPESTDGPPGIRARPKRQKLPLRTAGIAAIVVVLGLTTAVDRFVRRSVRVAAIPLVSAGPIATADGGGSSTWICSGGEGETDASIVIANPTDAPTIGRVRFLGPVGLIAESALSLPVGRRSELVFPEVTTAAVPTTTPEASASDPATANEVPIGRGIAAVLEFDRGGIVVERRLGAGRGAVAPCAPSASTHWYLPDGATTRDASTTLSLVNPFTDDAIVDMWFATESGPARPTQLQGYVVPAGTVRTIDVGAYVRRRSNIAASIVNRTGRVIAEGVLRFDGSGTNGIGSTIVQAAPARGSAWYFPSGRTSSVLAEQYLIDNPGDHDVTVEVTVLLAGAEAEPFEIDVAARSVTVFDPSEEARIPTGADYSLVAATPANRPIVVARRLRATSRFRKGIASTLGGRIVANRWTIADAQANGAVDDRLAILNPTDEPAKVSVYRLAVGADDPWAEIAGLQNVPVDAGERLDVRLGDFVALSGDAVVVVADGSPVFVDRSRTRVQAPGDRPVRPDFSTVAGRGYALAVERLRALVATTSVVPATTAVVSTTNTVVSTTNTVVSTTSTPGPTTSVVARTSAVPVTTTSKPNRTATARTVAVPRIGRAATGTSTALAVPSTD